MIFENEEWVTEFHQLLDKPMLCSGFQYRKSVGIFCRFVVEADRNIKDLTIIAEYTGEVDYMCRRQHDSGNSIMGLLFSDDPAKELVICPDRRSNIARFVSGINNHTP